MAWSYLSRIFSFSYGNDRLGHPSSKSDDESPPTSQLSPVTGPTVAHDLARQSDSKASNGIGEVPIEAPKSHLAESIPKTLNDPNEASESHLTNSAFKIPNDNLEIVDEPSQSHLVDSASESHNQPPESHLVDSVLEIPTDNAAISAATIPNNIEQAPNEPSESDLTNSTSGIANDNVEAFNEPPESILTEPPPASQPDHANSAIKAILSRQSGIALSSSSLQATTSYESLDLEPNLNISQVSLMIRSARQPGNKSALKQVKSFFKKAAKTVRKKQTPAQIYVVDNWDSHSARSRRSSTFSLRSTINLPSQPPESSSLPSSSPKIFIDASAYGIGFIFNDRWLAWTFVPNHPNIILGSDGKINMSWAELISAELGILTLLSCGYRDMQVRVRSDNIGVVKALKTRTWTPNHGLDIILARILHLCEEARLELEVGWIPTEENPADGPSRGQYPPLDAMLDCRPRIPHYLQGIIIQVEAGSLLFP